MTDVLNSLIRLRRWEVDERQRALAETVRVAEALHQDLADLDAAMTAEQAAAREAPAEWSPSYSAYARVALQRRRTLLAAIAKAEERVGEARERLGEAYRELCKVDIVREERAQQAAEEARHQEQMLLDDIGIDGFRRRQTNRDHKPL